MTTLRFSLSKFPLSKSLLLVLLAFLLTGLVGGANAAATLTLTAGSLDATGRVATFTVSGSSGALTPTSAVTGLLCNDGVYNAPVTSSSVSGTTLTVNFGCIAASGAVVKVTASGSNLTDASSNTLANGNYSATNNSVVAQTNYNLVTNKNVFDVNAVVPVGGSYNGAPMYRFDGSATLSPYPVEFVANCTDIEVIGYLGGGFSCTIDGGLYTGGATGIGMAGAITIAAGLPAGNHLFQVGFGSQSYTNGFRISGGNHTITTIPKTKVTWLNNTGPLYYGVLAGPSPIAIWGTCKPSGYGDYSGIYNGQQVEFGFSGTALDVTNVIDQISYAVSLDSAPVATLVPGVNPGGANTNTYSYIRFADGLSAGLHTFYCNQVSGSYQSGTHQFLGARVLNGARLTAATTAGATTFTLDRTVNFTVSDWIMIDAGTSTEYRQVTAQAGSVFTVAAFANAHAQNISVSSWVDTPGVFFPYSPDAPKYQKRIVGIGDSNTQGANTYGIGNYPDANGAYYNNYDNRSCFGYQAAKMLGWEWVNLGVQGTDTNNQVARKGDIMLYGRGSYDYVTILEGTNDINSNSTTPANFGPNVQQQIDAAAPGLRAGGKILLIPEQQTYNQVSASGLSCPVINGILRTLAANGAIYTGAGTYKNSPYSSFVVYCSHAWDGVNLTTPWNAATNPLGDIEGSLHFRPSGQTKLARNLVNYYLSPTRVRNNSRIGTRSGQSD